MLFFSPSAYHSSSLTNPLYSLHQPAIGGAPAYFPSSSHVPSYPAQYPSTHPDPELDILSSEVRYRRALQEVRSAEQEYNARLALARAQEEALRRRKEREEALERAQIQQALALQAEVERLRLEQEQQRLVALEAERQRALLQRRQTLAAQAEATRRASQRQLFEQILGPQGLASAYQPPMPSLSAISHSYPHPHASHSPAPVPHPQATTNYVDLVRELAAAGILATHAVSTPTSPPVPTSDSMQAQKAAAPPSSAAAPQSIRPASVEVNLQDIFKFLTGLQAQNDAPEATKPQFPAPQACSTSLPAVAPLSDPAPTPVPSPNPKDVKGKGKAPNTPVPTSLDELLKQRLGKRFEVESEQEIKDTLQAIFNSLQDQSGPGATHASSSKITVENTPKMAPTEGADLSRAPALAGAAAAKVQAEYQEHRRTTSASSTSAPVPAPAPSTSRPSTPSTPLTPLNTISTIRSSLHSLTTTFRFPAALEFDSSADELAYTPVNAPVRAYEHALNGLLAQLDAVDSDGDEEVRVRRREVVREVEVALEDVDKKITPDTADSASSQPDVQDPASISTKPVIEEVVIPAASESSLPAVELVSVTAPESMEPIAEVTQAPEATPIPSPAVDTASASALPLPTTESSFTPVHDVHEPSSTPGPAGPSPNPSESFLSSLSHDQFTFPPQPSNHTEGELEDSVVIEREVDSVGSVSDESSVTTEGDEWSEVDA
ncbi:hypothetical protein OF83DRAFT_227968 [Amylostereum chailletii]|nr:hypothetical protein OF83DRAFT_227968 [Amylostereum chailletii]